LGFPPRGATAARANAEGIPKGRFPLWSFFPPFLSTKKWGCQRQKAKVDVCNKSPCGASRKIKNGGRPGSVAPTDRGGWAPGGLPSAHTDGGQRKVKLFPIFTIFNDCGGIAYVI
jgi:hypothetical protein